MDNDGQNGKIPRLIACHVWAMNQGIPIRRRHHNGTNVGVRFMASVLQMLWQPRDKVGSNCGLKLKNQDKHGKQIDIWMKDLSTSFVGIKQINICNTVINTKADRYLNESKLTQTTMLRTKRTLQFANRGSWLSGIKPATTDLSREASAFGWFQKSWTCQVSSWDDHEPDMFNASKMMCPNSGGFHPKNHCVGVWAKGC